MVLFCYILFIALFCANSRECDPDMMNSCCGHWHRMRHFSTYRETRAYLQEHKELIECPKWFKQKCTCFGGK